MTALRAAAALAASLFATSLAASPAEAQSFYGRSVVRTSTPAPAPPPAPVAPHLECGTPTPFVYVAAADLQLLANPTSMSEAFAYCSSLPTQYSLKTVRSCLVLKMDYGSFAMYNVYVSSSPTLTALPTSSPMFANYMATTCAWKS